MCRRVEAICRLQRSKEDLSIFYYCEQDYANGTVVGTTSYNLPQYGCTFLVSKVWCMHPCPSDRTLVLTGSCQSRPAGMANLSIPMILLDMSNTR